MKKVSYFIVGAPKCATSTLRTLLNEYYLTFLPSPIEPNFFCTDLSNPKKKISYHNYYKNSKKDDVLGDKSTWYLSSKVAGKNIIKYNKKAKFIIILRNPIDMYFSLHKQLIRNGVEDELNPEKAWYKSLHKKRVKKNFLLDYANMCKIGTQSNIFIKSIKNKNNFMIIFFEEFIKNQKKILLEVGEFLKLKKIKKIEHINLNENMSPNIFYLKNNLFIFKHFKNTFIKKILLKINNIFLLFFKPNIENKNNKNLFFKKKLQKHFKNEIKVINKIKNSLN